MADWKTLTQKAVKTFQEEGFQMVGEKTKQYLKHRREEKREQLCADGCFRDVLFINGCDEHLPHPGRYRVSHQREQLESLGMSTGEVYYQNLQMESLRCYRIFLFFRCPYTDTIGAFVERARQINKTVLYDIDDLVIDTAYTDMIPYLDTMLAEERRTYDENVKQMGKLLRLCDGAITTTSALAQELEQYVPSVLVNRNVASEEMKALSDQALERREAQRAEAQKVKAQETTAESENEKITQKEAGEEPVKMGYFSGSITHDDDFAMILPVLVHLMGEYSNLQLHLAGELTLPEALLPYKERIEVHPFTDWRELPERIAQMDINLAPLTNTVFNRAKSENKWLEAALVKVPTVASDIGAFHEMVENGKTGILCQNEGQWEEALRALIEQPHYRSLIGEAAFAYCSHFCVTANTGIELHTFLQEKKKENLVFLLPGFQVSGGVMVALQHGRILQKEGKDVLLLSIDEKGKEQWYEFEDTRFPVLNANKVRITGRIDRAVATMWSTVEWLYRFPSIKERAYLVQNYEPDFYKPGSLLRMQARRTYGDYPALSYLTISKWCQEWLQESYGHAARYAPNGLEWKKFSQAEERREWNDERKVRILIEGDSSAIHKNVDESFRIIEKLDPQKYEIWYMAYHGEPKEWYRVDRFLPKVPYEEVQEIYKQCDILLKSSLLESFSYPPLEMMASGGLVIAVLNEGNREYLRDEENCLLYLPGDIEGGAAAIEHLREDAALRRKLMENGKMTAKSRDWQQIREQILALYQ